MCVSIYGYIWLQSTTFSNIHYIIAFIVWLQLPDGDKNALVETMKIPLETMGMRKVQ